MAVFPYSVSTLHIHVASPCNVDDLFLPTRHHAPCEWNDSFFEVGFRGWRFNLSPTPTGGEPAWPKSASAYPPGRKTGNSANASNQPDPAHHQRTPSAATSGSSYPTQKNQNRSHAAATGAALERLTLTTSPNPTGNPAPCQTRNAGCSGCGPGDRGPGHRVWGLPDLQTQAPPQKPHRKGTP